VDDDEGVTRSLQRLLLFEGYRVLIANSASEGFEQLSLNRVEVIVSDFQMPGMNGAEFLGRVKELHPATVRLVLTGHADLAAVTDSINIGAIYKILHKPWRDDEFRDQIGSAFRYHEKLYGKGRESDAVSLQQMSVREVASCYR
jgi:DNA-binding NtrC family response regulator